MDELHNMWRARCQFNLEACRVTNTQSEYGSSLAGNVEHTPDTTGCIFNMRLDVFAVGIFLLVDIQSGKRHRNRNEHAVYGEVHTRTDPPTVTKRVCE